MDVDKMLPGTVLAPETPIVEPEPPAPLPLADWPAWAKAVYDERELGTDKGVGDTVHRRLGDGGLMVQAWAKVLGVPCGCAARRWEWNTIYPYGCGDPGGLVK